MRLRSLVLVVLALAALAGPASASGAGYRASADAICRQANTQLAALGAPRSDAAVRQWLPRAVRIYSRAVVRLRRLAPPPRMRVRHARWTVVLNRRVRAARALQVRIRRGAPPAKALAAAQPRLERLRRLARARARALALRDCSGRAAR